MTDNEIKKALEDEIRRANYIESYYIDCVDIGVFQNALDLINRQKAEIERLNKDCEDVIYKLEYLLCNATGNKFSKYTYPIGDMVSYVNDYIQDCCNEAVEETKEAVKSEAIKEFAERLKEVIQENHYYTSTEDMGNRKRYTHITNIKDFSQYIDNLVKEMTEVQE